MSAALDHAVFIAPLQAEDTCQLHWIMLYSLHRCRQRTHVSCTGSCCIHCTAAGRGHMSAALDHAVFIAPLQAEATCQLHWIMLYSLHRCRQRPHVSCTGSCCIHCTAAGRGHMSAALDHAV